MKLKINKTLLEEASEKIKQSERIAVISHIRPDGDAIGSLLAVGLSLKEQGKLVQMVLADRIPENFTFLKGFEQVKTFIQYPVDMVIVVDCSEKSRIGQVLSPELTPDLNIDHHITNQEFAIVNLIDTEAAATAEILFNIFPKLNLQLTPEVIDALLTGILTDTIGFRTSNVSPTTLRIAATLMEEGANLPNLYKQTLASRSFPALKYWGFGLNKLTFDNKMVWATLTLEDREKSGYSGRDDADLINLISAIEDVNIAVLFIEQHGGSVKISWRAQNGYDVSELAEQFGGGGHRAASGAELMGTLLDVQEAVLRKTRDILI